MTEQSHVVVSEAARAIRAFLAICDRHDAHDRQVAAMIRGRLHSELYRREREQYPEWVDHGGEA